MSDASHYDIDVALDIKRVRGSGEIGDSFDWFQRLWGVAVIAHVVGNPRVGELVPDFSFRGAATLVLGMLAVSAVLLPSDRLLLGGIAIMTPVVAWLEAPVLGNHWLLAALVSIALGATLILGVPWNRFTATARALLVVFYGFAAFSKINSDFLDPAVSCASALANPALRALHLPAMDPSSGLAALVPMSIVAVEMSIPVLLLSRRTRFVGVMVGLVFHSLISFDLDRQFFDFTSVLYPLFLLWLPTQRLEPLGEHFADRTQALMGVILSVFVIFSVLPDSRFSRILIHDAVFLIWVPFAVFLVVFVLLRVRAAGDVTSRPVGVVAWVLVGVSLLNGLAPYVEVKTATAWNMYSNLAVVNGQSNHLLVRSGVPLRDAHRDLVEVLRSTDPGLALYVGSGWLLPEENLFDHLADQPAATVEYRQGDSIETLAGAEVERRSLVARKFVTLRAIDSREPARCKTVWFPAR